MKLLKFFLLIPLILICTLFNVDAGEGMWLPHLLKALNEAEMQSMGMKLSAEDIYSVNKGSLKDAIVHFGGFCTSEIISPNGLLLTNHHCGYRQLQFHSSVENNIIKNGFWAKNYSEELPNAGLTAIFIDYIEDVTSQILAGVKDGMAAGDRQSLIDKNLEAHRKMYTLESYQDVIIRPFFAGNQYFAFVTTTYRDVRLVGAPPESIGKFGADTDNWVWPRHTGDFALFRIYADKDNKPADYSLDNVPYTPKHYLPISVGGVEPGDFTMVFGFPGRTNQYLPASAIKQIDEVINPARISVRETSLNIMDKYMRKDEATRIKYAAKYASIANYWKKWIGESLGLKKSNAVQKKLDYEFDFTKRLSKNSTHKGLLQEMDKRYKEMEPYELSNEYMNEIFMRNVDMTSFFNRMRGLVNTYENNGEEAYKKGLSRFKDFTEGFYKDFDIMIDEEKLVALTQLLKENQAKDFLPDFIHKEEDLAGFISGLYQKTAFRSKEENFDILDKSPTEAISLITSDPFFIFCQNWVSFHVDNVAGTLGQQKRELDVLQAQYMKAQMEVFSDKRFYPDANSTMRITYGQVNGYNPRDAVQYEHVTYLDGVMEKYVPGDYEFDLDERMVELFKRKDYGDYADKNGKLPVCFIGSNHTTGGNSGSPAIDAHGNLIGLNFDRVWEGTMSDLNYDAGICRNIMVDARYILWVIDKYANAGHLIKEMKLVNPKL